VTLQGKSFVLNHEELEVETDADQVEVLRRVRGGRRTRWM
jgi:hypothetical protein